LYIIQLFITYLLLVTGVFLAITAVVYYLGVRCFATRIWGFSVSFLQHRFLLSDQYRL